jgi:dihydroneopterin aldolase
MNASPPKKPAGRGKPGIYRILVKDLVVAASIGAHRHEHDAPQRVRINLELDVREGAKPIHDELTNVVDYETVVVAVRKVVTRHHINLVESMADDVAEACFIDKSVERVRVRIEKLDVFADTASVGVEIERMSR